MVPFLSKVFNILKYFRKKMKRIQMKKIHVLIILIVSLFILSGCLFPAEEDLLPPGLLQPEEVRFQTIEVERGSIQDILEGSVIAASAVHYEMTFHNRSGFLVELDVRLAQVVSEGDILARLDTDSLEMDISRQRLDVERRRLALEEVSTRGGNRFARRYAELDLEMAELVLQQLEDELAKSTIVAPVDGEVVFLGNFRIGEFVPGRSVVVIIADPSHIHFEYTGALSDRISHGMEVDLVVGTQNIPATVSMTQANAPAEERDRFRNTVIISANNPGDLPEGVRIGSRFNFSIFVEERQDTIIIPMSAISTFMGQRFAQVLEGGMRTERDLTLGITTTRYAEVLHGLDDGDLLIVGIER